MNQKQSKNSQIIKYQKSNRNHKNIIQRVKIEEEVEVVEEEEEIIKLIIINKKIIMDQVVIIIRGKVMNNLHIMIKIILVIVSFFGLF